MPKRVRDTGLDLNQGGTRHKRQLRPQTGASMHPLLQEIRHNRLLWLLVFVPVLLVAHAIRPEAHTLLFLLSVLAIVPLAGLLSRATEAVAARTGDTVGGLLNATLGNLTEMMIALTALHAGQYTLVKASLARSEERRVGEGE